uniref:Vesicle-fusing ATPase n=1 Tax=Caenorhabditis tropicalis TaxID=1561998 RepID=A0A1I7UD62_9PELO
MSQRFTQQPCCYLAPSSTHRPVPPPTLQRLTPPRPTTSYSTEKMFRVRKAPSEEHTLANFAYVNKADFDATQIKHIRIDPGPAHHYIFSIRNDPSIKQGEIAFGVPHRKWAVLSLDQEIRVSPFTFQSSEYIGSIVLSADFNAKKNVTSEPLNADLMAREFSMQFGGQAFTKGMRMAFRFEDKEKNKTHTLSLTVKSIEGFDINKAAIAASGGGTADDNKPKPIEHGELLPNSGIVFDKEEGSMLNLIGKSKGKSAYRSIINPNWDLQQMGIGGLDNEFSNIFRRAFASRILRIHTARMREYNKLDPNVDLDELSKRTKNFSGAELEGLVRAAQSSAMNRLVKAGNKAEVDPDAIEKLMINPGDFEHALENDVKPQFGRSDDALNRFQSWGMTVWGPEINDILSKGDLSVSQVRNLKARGFKSVLIVGEPKTGKTSLAAQIARNSDFPFVKVVSQEEMIGLTESAKCMALKKAFEDAKRSKLSLLLVDNIDRLIDYSPIGPRFSNPVVQTLLVLFNTLPPPGHRLLVLVTSSSYTFLKELGFLDVVSRVIEVPRLSTPEQMVRVIQETNNYTDEQILEIERNLRSLVEETRLKIGVKHLLELVEEANESQPEYQVTSLLEEIEAVATK